jgi:hypothetical protein
VCVEAPGLLQGAISNQTCASAGLLLGHVTCNKHKDVHATMQQTHDVQSHITRNLLEQQFQEFIVKKLTMLMSRP